MASAGSLIHHYIGLHITLNTKLQLLAHAFRLIIIKSNETPLFISLMYFCTRTETSTS